MSWRFTANYSNECFEWKKKLINFETKICRLDRGCNGVFPRFYHTKSVRPSEQQRFLVKLEIVIDKGNQNLHFILETKLFVTETVIRHFFASRIIIFFSH